jgi:proline iminopeptidase
VSIVDLNGTSLYYEVDGTGPPCLVLHGGLGVDHQLYRRTLGPLAASSTLVFYDHRGNGRSARPPVETITMEQLADDAAGLATHLGFDRFAVLGHSFGGFVAQELALRHGDRVDRLVLVATTPGQLGHGESADDYAGPPPPDEFVQIVSTMPENDDQLARVMVRLLPFYLPRADPASVADLFDGVIISVAAMARGFEVLAGWSSVDRLGAISCPVRIACGRLDVFTAAPQADRIADRITDAEVVIFERSGHFPWIEEPDQFFPTVTGWLA